jgi:hypothetical protein
MGLDIGVRAGSRGSVATLRNPGLGDGIPLGFQNVGGTAEERPERPKIRDFVLTWRRGCVNFPVLRMKFGLVP